MWYSALADYLDIFTAPDIQTATKVATIIRTFGHEQPKSGAATEWEKFTGLLPAFRRGWLLLKAGRYTKGHASSSGRRGACGSPERKKGGAKSKPFSA